MKDFREITTANFCSIETTTAKNWSAEDFRTTTTNDLSVTNWTTTTKNWFAKDFRTTTTNYLLITSFRTTTTKNWFAKNFRKTTAMKSLFRLIIDKRSTTIFKRSKMKIALRMTLSYFRIKFITSSSSKRFFYSLCWGAYSFQRTRYFESRRAICRLFISRSIFYDLTRSMFLSTKIEFDWFERERLKESTTESKQNFNWTTNNIECMRQWVDNFNR